jgi:hypothetical protein
VSQRKGAIPVCAVKCRVAGGQFVGVLPVRGGPAVVKQSRRGQREGTGADRDHPRAPGGGLAQRRAHPLTGIARSKASTAGSASASAACTSRILEERTRGSSYWHHGTVQVFGLELGDAIVARTVGGRVTPAVIQDLAWISYLHEMKTPDADWFEFAVMHHTDCGSGFFADDALRHGFAARGFDDAELAALAVLDPAATVPADPAVPGPCLRRSC